jgi:chemotaxis protein histidine kinase CheA
MEDLLDNIVENTLEPGQQVLEFLKAASLALQNIISSQPIDEHIDLDGCFDRATKSLASDQRVKSNGLSRRVIASTAPAVGPERSDEVPRVSTPIVRVSLERLDDILEVSRNLSISRSAISERLSGMRHAGGIEPDAYRSITHLLDSQRLLMDELQSKLLRIRMVRFGTLETRLGRTVHSTCLDENKKAALHLENGNVEIDTQIIDALVEPLLHLLKNAVVHGIEPAETRRLIGKPAEGVIRVRLDADDEGVILSVTDDGAGISAARLRAKALATRRISAEAARVMDDRTAIDLIFDRGLTTAEKVDLNAGRGVGMSIVKESVEGGGGTVLVESEPQRGTTFTIVMPSTSAKQKHAVPVDHAMVADPPATASPLVMIVDDSATIRRQSAQLVEEAGYRTINAADGAEALEFLLSGKFEPDLILSDVEMPQVDGWEFLKYLKSDDNFGHIPVVMITSLDSEQYRKRAFDLGASNYLVKPYKGAELERILADILAPAPA